MTTTWTASASCAPDGGKAYYKCDGAIAVTISRYTEAARRLARETGTQLWGINELIAAMNKVKAVQGSPR